MAIFSKGFQRFIDEAEKKDSAAGMTPALSPSKELSLDEIIQEFGPKQMSAQQRGMMNQSDATKRSNANAVRQGAQAIMDMDLLNINDQQLMQAYQNANAMNASMDAQLGMAAQDPRLPSYSPQLRAAQATLQRAQTGIGRSQGGVNEGWLNSGKSAVQIRNETYQARKSNIGNYSDYEQLMKDLNLDVNADLAADLYQAGKGTTMVRNPENVKQAIAEASDEELERMRQGEDPGFLNRLAYGVNSALGVKQKSSQQENYDAIVEEQKRRKDAAEEQRIVTWQDIDSQYDAKNGTLWNMLTPEEQQEALEYMRDITPETMETWAADVLKDLTPEEASMRMHFENKGNINLYNRTPVTNEDGSISTVDSFSVNIDGKEVLLPTVIDGRRVTQDEAIQHFYDTGEHLGIFDTPEEADDYAQKLHEQQEILYTKPETAESVQQFMDLTDSGNLYKTYSDIYAQEAQQRRDDWIKVGKGDYTGTDPDMKKANDAINAANDRIEEIWDALLQFDLGDESPERQALETELAELQNQLNGLYENVDAMAAGATEKLDAIKSTLYGKGSIGRLIGTSVMEGFGNFADRAYKSFDFIVNRPINAVGQLITGDKNWQNPTSKWINNYGVFADQLRQENDKAIQALGGGFAAETFSNALSGLVENIPNTLMAIMTGGAANAGGLGAVQTQAIQQLMEAGASRTIAQKIVTNAVTDPQYWLTFMQEVGSDYQEALKESGSENAATVYAMVSALINSQIEIGVEGNSGIQGLGQGGDGGNWRKVVMAVTGKDYRMLAQILDSFTDEATEEFKQNLVSGLAAMAIYDHDRQWVSFVPGEEALLNVPDVGKESLVGGITGALLAGGTEPTTQAIYASSADAGTGSNIIGNNQAEALAGIAEDSAHIHNATTEGIKNGTLDLNSRKGQRAVGKLWRDTYAKLDDGSRWALNNQLIRPVAAALEEAGYQGDAETAAAVIAKEYRGEELTKEEMEVLEDPTASQVEAQLFEGEFADEGEEGIKFDESDVKRNNYYQSQREDLNTIIRMPDIRNIDAKGSKNEGAKVEMKPVDTKFGTLGTAKTETTESTETSEAETGEENRTREEIQAEVDRLADEEDELFDAAEKAETLEEKQRLGKEAQAKHAELLNAVSELQKAGIREAHADENNAQETENSAQNEEENAQDTVKSAQGTDNSALSEDQQRLDQVEAESEQLMNEITDLEKQYKNTKSVSEKNRIRTEMNRKAFEVSTKEELRNRIKDRMPRSVPATTTDTMAAEADFAVRANQAGQLHAQEDALRDQADATENEEERRRLIEKADALQKQREQIVAGIKKTADERAAQNKKSGTQASVADQAENTPNLASDITRDADTRISGSGIVPDDEKGTETARVYGLSGRSYEELIQNLDDANVEYNIGEIGKAYERANTERRNRVRDREQQIRELNQGGKTKQRNGVVRSISAGEAKAFGVQTVHTSVSGEARARRNAAITAMRQIAGRLNMNIVLYESGVDANGNRTGANGWYDRSTDTVYIDMFAGYGNEQAILRTLAHELTHFIQNWSPEGYRQLQEFLTNYYHGRGKGTLAQLVQAQMDTAEKNGHKIDEVKAMDEVVADACEMMLSDPDAARTLVKENKTLAQKIKGWIDKLCNAIRTAMEGIDAHSREARLLMEMQDKWQKAQQLWYDALNEAAENRGGDYTTAKAEGIKAKSEDVNKTSQSNDVQRSDRELITTNGIMPGMSDLERYGVLRNAQITITDATGKTDTKTIKRASASSARKESIEALLTPIARQYGLIPNPGENHPEVTLKNRHLTIEAEFSKRSLHESLLVKNNNAGNIAALLPVMAETYENAIPIMLQGNRYKLTAKEEMGTNSFVYLLGAYKYGGKTVPVQFEIKKDTSGNNTLYVVATTKEDVLFATSPGVARDVAPTSSNNLSIEDVIENVKPEDTRILSYLPAQFLNEAQATGKRQGLIDQGKRIADKALEAGKNVNGPVAMKVSRIDDEIHNNGAPFAPNYSKAYMTYINPADFVRLNARNTGIIENEARAMIASELADNKETPYMIFDQKTGQIVGHEGRHRMQALADMGVKKVAILMKPDGTEGRNNRQSINELHVKGKGGFTATLYNLIPVNEAHRQELIDTYGDGAKENWFQYSMRDTVPTPRQLTQEAKEEGFGPHTDMMQFSVRGVTEAAGLSYEIDENGTRRYILRDRNGNIVAPGSFTAEMVKGTPAGQLIDMGQRYAKNKNRAEADAHAQRKFIADIVNMIGEFQDAAMVWELAGSMAFSTLKTNGDPQYSDSYDFGTICAKTQAILNTISETQLRLGRALTKEEIDGVVYEEVGKGVQDENGKWTHGATPCPVCYVYATWVNKPARLDLVRKFRDQYKNWTDRQIDNLMNYEAEQQPGETKSAYNERVTDLNRRKLWVSLCLAEEKTGKDGKKHWVRRANPELCPNEILLDLRRSGDMATKYPQTWLFMQRGGNAMGKAINEYADSRLGETIIGKAQGADTLGEKLLTDEVNKETYGEGYVPKFVNPFLSGNQKAAEQIFRKALTNIKKQNLKGGQRWQSWSDFRAEWGSDYLMEMLTMQLLQSQVQTYTKVAEAVDLLASAGFEVNLSGMPHGDGFWHNEDGSIKRDRNGNPMLRFSPVTGINPDAALEYVRKYGSKGNVQFMTVGISDEHIRAALASDYVTFCIPFHGSGGSVRRVQHLMSLLREQMQTGNDYTNAQSDSFVEKNSKGENTNPNWALRTAILEGQYDKLTDDQKATIRKNEYLNRLYEERYEYKDSEAYGVFFSHDEAKQIYPYEYWDKHTTLETADVNSLRFIEYCQLLGVIPRFSGLTKTEGTGKNARTVEYANFSGARRDAAGNITGYDPVPGYWKLLIDRSMYNRAYDDKGNLIPSQSTYHTPRTVSVNDIDIGMMPKAANNTVGYADDDVRQISERIIQRIQMTSAQNKAAGDAFNNKNNGPETEPDTNTERTDPGDGIKYSLRERPAPQNVIYGYKAFYARDGKLYPPMVSNIADEEQKVSKATSGTMKGLPTPVGVWLDADVGGILVDENGFPVRASTTGRLRVKNDKSGGKDSGLAFRPGWHLGEWPDAKQFNKMDPVTGERGKLMPDDLVFALCEVSADNDYQLDALSYGINEKGGFSRSQAGLPWIPEDGYYKYRTNVDPTTAPWLIAGSIRVVEILDDDDCARICAQYGVTPDKRYSGKKINLADYGLKAGPVTPDTEGMERFRKNEASRANDRLLNESLNDPEYANAYVQRDIDFDNPKQYEQLQKEFEMNGQNIEDYREIYNRRGYLGRQQDIQRSERDPEYKTDRQILAEALEGAAANSEERQMLKDYKELASTLDQNEQLVRSLNEQIRNLRLEEQNSDAENRLIEERNRIQKAIDAADRKLYDMERMAPMRRIAKGERRKAENDLQKAKEHMERYRAGILRREAIGHIERTSRRLAKWLTAPAGKSSNYVPETLRRPLGEFLLTIDKMSAQRRAGGPMTEEDRKFANQLQQIEQMLRNIERSRNADTQDDIEEQYAGYVDLPMGFTDTLGSLVVRVRNRMTEAGANKNVLDQMTQEELDALDMSLTAISSSITHINEFLTDSFAKSVSETAQETIDEMREYKRQNNNLRGLQRAADFVQWDNVMPTYAFNRFGESGRRVFNALREGQDKLAFNAKRIIDLAEELYTAEEAQEWSKEIKEFIVNPGTGDTVRMTVAHLMSLYALSRRAQALGHLVGEGFRVTDFKEKNKTITDKGHVINEGMLHAMVNTLTERQRQVTESLVNTMSTLGSDWGNYVSMRRFGYKQFTEKYYFPIKSDTDLLPAKTDTSTGNELYKLLNMSMTKPLTQKANNRIMLENIFDVFASHMSDMALYNAMALPMLDAVKWLNYKSSEQEEGETAKYTDGVRDAIRDAFGTAAVKYITELFKDVNGGGNVNDTGVDLTQKMLSRYNRVAVAANLRVALLQPLAIIRAGNELPGTSLAKGTLKAIPRLKSEIQEMQEKSGIALWKSLGYRETNIGRSVKQQIQHMETLTDKISDKSMFLAELGDQVTWGAMWMASKEYIRKTRRDLVPGTDAYFEAVKQKFEDVIYNTQVVDSILTKSQLMRSSKTTNRMMSSFMSEPTTTFNTLMQAWDRIRLDMKKGKSFAEAWQKNGLSMGRTALCFLIAAAVETAIAQIMSAYRDDDDYETFMEKVKDGWWQTLVDNMNPLTLLPGIKQIYEAGVKPLLGMETYDDQNVLTEGISTTVQGIQKIMEGKGTVWGRAYTLARGISMTTGIPIHPVMREFQALWNNTVVQIQPNWRLETSKTQDSVGYNLLYQAYAAGDTERQEQLKERLLERGSDNDKITNAMNTRIKSDLKSGEITQEEAEKRIQDLTGKDANDAYFKTQQMLDSDFSKYSNLETAIKTGTGYKEAVSELTSHGVDPKDVQTKARSVISQMAIEDKLSESEIQKLFTQYGGMTADEAYIRSQELRYQQLTGTQTTSDAAMVFYAIDNKTSPKAAIDGLTKHGKEAKSIASSITSKYKQQYLDLISQGKKSEAAALKGRLITVFDYLGYDGSKKIEDWEKPAKSK